MEKTSSFHCQWVTERLIVIHYFHLLLNTCGSCGRANIPRLSSACRHSQRWWWSNEPRCLARFVNAVKQRAVYTDSCSHQTSPVALRRISRTNFACHPCTTRRMCGTNTYLLVLYNAINWLLPHSSKTLPGGVFPQTLAGPEGSGVQTSACVRVVPVVWRSLENPSSSAVWRRQTTVWEQGKRSRHWTYCGSLCYWWLDSRSRDCSTVGVEWRVLYMVSTPSPFTKEALKVLQLIFRDMKA